MVWFKSKPPQPPQKLTPPTTKFIGEQDGAAERDLKARFGDAGVFELTYQIGLENMRARVNAALGITEQGFNSGDACRIPWATP